MGAINAIPNGLLSLLESKTQGKLPFTLNESVAPTLDLLEFYMARFFQVRQSSLSTIRASGTAQIVPNDKVWFLLNVGCSWISTAAPQSSEVMLTIERAGGMGSNETVIGSLGKVSPVAIGDRAITSLQLNKPWALTSGTRVVFTTLNSVAPGPIQQVYSQFWELDV